MITDLFIKIAILLNIEKVCYMFIYKFSILGFAIKPKLFIERKKNYELAVNSKVSMKEFLPYSSNGLISYKLGIKLFTKKYSDKNIIWNCKLKPETIFVSAHIGQTHFLYKLFKYMSYKCTYIKSNSLKSFDFKSNEYLYNNEYIFVDKKQILDITKRIYNKGSIYVSLDGSITNNKLLLNNEYYTNYSSLIPSIGMKKNINIAFISLIILTNGKTVVDIDYYNKSENFDAWYRKKYLETLSKYPYSFNSNKLSKGTNQ